MTFHLAFLVTPLVSWFTYCWWLYSLLLVFLMFLMLITRIIINYNIYFLKIYLEDQQGVSNSLKKNKFFLFGSLVVGAHTFYLTWRNGVSGVRTPTHEYIIHLSLPIEISSRGQKKSCF